MDAEMKKKILSSAAYALSVANGALGVFAAKRGYYLEGSAAFYVGLPLLVLAICAFLPLALRKKEKLAPACALAAVGTLFYLLWFFVFAKDTVIGVMTL
jgi:hypothetical protein